MPALAPWPHQRPITAGQYRLLQIASASLGLTTAQLLAVVQSVGKVDAIRNLNQRQFARVMKAMEQRGFVKRPKNARRPSRERREGHHA